MNRTRRPEMFDCERCWRRTANLSRVCRKCLGNGYAQGKVPTPKGGSTVIEREAARGVKEAVRFLEEHERRVAAHQQRIEADMRRMGVAV